MNSIGFYLVFFLGTLYSPFLWVGLILIAIFTPKPGIAFILGIILGYLILIPGLLIANKMQTNVHSAAYLAPFFHGFLAHLLTWVKLKERQSKEHKKDL